MLLVEEAAAHVPWGRIWAIFFAFWAVVLITLFLFIPRLASQREKKSGHH